MKTAWTTTAVVFLLAGASAMAQQQTETMAGPDAGLKDTTAVSQLLRMAKPDREAIGALYEGLTETSISSLSCGTDVLVHIVVWKGRAIDRQRWLTYSACRPWGNDDAVRSRLFGARSVQLITVHRDVPSGASYRLDVARKESDQLTAVKALIGIVSATVALEVNLDDSSPGDNPWKYKVQTVSIQHAPSDLSLSVLLPTKPGAPDGEVAAVAKQVFDNEAGSRWQVSVALPVSRVSQLEYTAADGTVRRREVDKQNLFALVNVSPTLMDTKRMRWKFSPNAVLGVGIVRRPLDRVLVGVSFGATLAQVIVGRQFTRISDPKSLREGASASDAMLSADLRSRYMASWIAALNVPATQLLDRLKK